MKPAELRIVHISLCYYVYDTFAGIYYQFNDFWMTVHHLLIFLAYFHSLYYSTLGSEMFATIFISEVSNPFLILMKTCQFEGRTSASVLMGGCFAVSYLYLRSYIGYLLARRVLLSNAELVMKVCCSCMRSLE